MLRENLQLWQSYIGLTTWYPAPSYCTTPPPSTHCFPTVPTPWHRRKKKSQERSGGWCLKRRVWKEAPSSGSVPSRQRQSRKFCQLQGHSSSPGEGSPRCEVSVQSWRELLIPRAQECCLSLKVSLKKSFEKLLVFQFGETMFCI